MRTVTIMSANAIMFCWIAIPSWADFTTVINVPPEVAPSSIGSDTQLNLFESGVLPEFFEAGQFLSTENTAVNIFGGSVGDRLSVSGEAVVNIFDGIVGFGVDLSDGSTLNIHGGTLGYLVNGGGALLHVDGGQIEGIHARPGSTTNLVGRQFLIGGEPIMEAMPGIPFVVQDRRPVRLTGLLVDGSHLDILLSSDGLSPRCIGRGCPGFSPDATLIVTIVPEPSALLLLWIGIAWNLFATCRVGR